MDDLRKLIAANLTAIRKAHHLTQAELAEKINYSDKVISKWERAESTPDVLILKRLADIYGITIDRFLKTEEQAAADEATAEETTDNAPDEAPVVPQTAPPRHMDHNQRIIVTLSIILVWFIALLGFVIYWGVTTPHRYYWYAFVCAAPVSLVVWLVLNSLWGIRRNNMYIISLLIWSILGAIFLGLIEYRLWLIFVLGIPAQIAAVLSFGFRKSEKPDNEAETPPSSDAK